MAEQNKPGQQTAPANADAQNKLQSSKEHARKAAEDLKSAAGAFAEEYRGKAEQAWGECTRQSRTSLGRCQGPRSNIPGRRRAVRARKSNESSIHGTRNWLRAGSDLPALNSKTLRK